MSTLLDRKKALERELDEVETQLRQQREERTILDTGLEIGDRIWNSVTGTIHEIEEFDVLPGWRPQVRCRDITDDRVVELPAGTAAQYRLLYLRMMK